MNGPDQFVDATPRNHDYRRRGPIMRRYTPAVGETCRACGRPLSGDGHLSYSQERPSTCSSEHWVMCERGPWSVLDVDPVRKPVLP
jgi:hypothetical protein